MDLTFKYRIIIIESLNTDNGDSLTGTHLFQNILQRLPSKFPYIETSFYAVHSLGELHKATDKIKSIVDNGDIVILHIEAHGGEEGVTLYDDSIISWIELYNLIRPINIKISKNVYLNFNF